MSRPEASVPSGWDQLGKPSIRQVDLIRIVRGKQRRKDRDENEQDDYGARGDRHGGGADTRDEATTV